MTRAAAKAARAEVLARYLSLRNAQPRDEGAVIAARNALVTLHMPFAVSMARRRARHGGAHVGLDDLVQASAMGLLRACESFDASRGLAFTTYAAWWIRSFINGALEGEPAIRLPAGLGDDLRRLARCERKRAARGLSVDDDEVARELGITRDKLARLIEARRLHAVSLDAPLDPETETTLHDEIGDGAELPDEAADRSRLAQTVRDLVARLPEREREIVVRRIEGHTLDAIGVSLGVCRERVRQVELDAHHALRRSQASLGR